MPLNRRGPNGRFSFEFAHERPRVAAAQAPRRCPPLALPEIPGTSRAAGCPTPDPGTPLAQMPVIPDILHKTPTRRIDLERTKLALLELFIRGYRFSDSEILARLVDAVVGGLEEELASMVQLLGDLEFYLGALGFRDEAMAAGLAVCLPEFVGPGGPRELRGLFNPLLLVSGVVPVPSDLLSERLASTSLVTGPNSGGKTRLLQSIGLTQLLAQSGQFVPAASAHIAWASGLVASLIEETRADQAEGRLGMELMRIRALFERLQPGALVLLDELCSGTNPSEGEQIFELVITMMSQLEPQAFITTHFLSFANRLKQEGTLPHLAFLQVELDAQRRPTYQFAPGVAGSSLAAHTAERLGVTGEQLSALIQQNLRVRQLTSVPGTER